MPAPEEPKALVVDILNEIVSYVKQSRPTRTDGKATEGFVYSQLRVGQMIGPIDFGKPWSPMGGAQASASATPGAPPAATSDQARRAYSAAFNTTQLVDTMMVVTDDSTLVTYSGGGRHLSLEYGNLLAAMEAPPVPERPADVQKRLDDARKVLWQDDGFTETPRYAAYLKNQKAVGDGVAAYAVAQAKILGDPAQADTWGSVSDTYQITIDQARDRWKSQGSDEIETALATTESLGIPLEQGMIASARKALDAWSLGISGVGVRTPYSYILPSEWALIEADNIGWTTLTSASSDYHSHYDQHGYGLATGNWAGDSSSTSGDAGIGIFGFGFNGGYSESEQSASSNYSASGSDGSTFHNDSQGLSVELQYGLCEIVRPWLITDLFRMRNWYLRGEKAGVISDGTIPGQVGKEQPLLPMIPTHFLVIRNVKIKADHWNSDGAALSSWFSNAQSSSSSSSSSVSGGVSIPVLGPFSIDANASHSDSHYQGQYRDESGNSYSNDYGSHWDGQTLEIKGAQIVAWLSEVVPASPPTADPSLTDK